MRLLKTGGNPSGRWRWFLVGVVLVLNCGHLQAQHTAREHQVKAAFLYNFSQFVEWPPSAFPSDDAPFIIGIVGQDPFGDFLDKLVADESIGDHRLTVVRYSSADAIRESHVLFLSLPTVEENNAVVAGLAGKPVLTVSDHAEFIRAGGMVQFVNEANRVRLRIGINPVERSGLIISSKLLRLSEVVQVNKNE